ncbi:MAG: translation initiation factor IF-2 associated domain-containing protein, partial [Allorhizobium sp.]
MTDNKDDKTIGVKKTLTLKPSGMSQGTVRQDMGRGRTKSVVVETVKRRTTRPLDEKPPITPITPVRAEPAAAAPTPAPTQAPSPVAAPVAAARPAPAQQH